MRKWFLTLAMTICAAIPAVATIDDIKFSRLDTRDGLSNSQIVSIFRDSKGFMWFSTPYGLNRYDGYRFKTFLSDAKDTTTLRSNYLDEVFEAYDGKLWIRQSMNYVIYDPVTEKFDRHPEVWLHERGVKGGIEKLFIDSHKDFWVKTFDEGFWHYSPRTGKVKQWRFGYGPQEFNNDFGVSTFVEYGKCVLVSSFNGEIFCFNRDDDRLSWKSNYLRKRGLTSNQDCKLRVDRYGNLFVMTTTSTFVKTNTKVPRWYHSLSDYLRSLGIEADLSEVASVWDVKFDKRRRMWIATDHHGLIIVDLKTKELRQFLHDKHDDTSISDNSIRFIYPDNMGRMWLGTYVNGISCFTESSSNFRNLELGNINTICVDKAGKYWLGTNDAGIICFDPQTEEKVIYDKASHGIGSNTMVGSLAASDGSVWFGTYEGGLIHIKDGHVTNYRTTGKIGDLANDNIWTIYEDQWGYIWLGTLGSGVQRLNPQTGEMSVPIGTKNSTIPSDYISTISRTKKGWMMVSHSLFYSLINPKTRKIINRNITDNQDGIGITEMSINAMEDSRGLAWQGSSSGATVWDPKTKKVYLIDMQSGLFGSTVNGIIEDERHTMWLVTDHGVSNVVPQKQWDGTYNFVVRSYNNRDGLQDGPYNQRSICYTPDGKLLVGGQGGLDIIDPRKMGKGRGVETPIFSGLKIAGHQVEVGEKVNGKVVLSEALDYSREITLSFNDEFTIQMGSNNGDPHNRSRFIYKMAGYSDVWKSTEEVNPNITYQSLRAGFYYLCVRMMNDDGTMGTAEGQIAITIQPPIWRTRWMILLYMLLIAIAAWFWRKWYMKRQKRRLEAEILIRETEKQSWMAEMRRKIAEGDAHVEHGVAPHEVTLNLKQDDLVAYIKKICREFKDPEGRSFKLSIVAVAEHLELLFDPSELKRAIYILLSNSVKFTPEECRISVGIARMSNGDAQLQIADNGLGVPEYARSTMFEPMTEGEGLGLDKVKAVVEAHHGTIRFEDNPGGGSIFIITLPVGDIVEEAEVIE